jgi:sec-independent protein translocase protein TatC
MEAFWSRLKLAFFAGIFLSMPLVLSQVWRFVQRGLFPKEKRFIFWLTAVSFLLFALGSAFCYFVVLPAGVKFLMEYGSDVLLPLISVSRYLSFVFGMVFSFGIIFELPLVIGILVKMGFLHASTLRKNRRLAIVIIFIAAAILTPSPDCFNQVLMAGPLIVLYEAGIIVARIIEKRRK